MSGNCARSYLSPNILFFSGRACAVHSSSTFAQFAPPPLTQNPALISSFDGCILLYRVFFENLHVLTELHKGHPDEDSRMYGGLILRPKLPRLLPRCSLGLGRFALGLGCTWIMLGLCALDAHSKWIEAFCTPSATSSSVIEELRPYLKRLSRTVVRVL